MFPQKRRFQQILSHKANTFHPLAGQLGNGLGTVSTGVDGMVYVRVGPKIEVALCTSTPRINNLLVWVGETEENPGILQVLGERKASAMADSDRVPAVQAHANTHEYLGPGAGGGTDVLRVQLGQFMPLRVYAYSGMTVAVYPGIVKTSTGRVLVANTNVYGKPIPTLIDLTAYRPLTGGNALYILISLSSAGALTLTSGDEAALTDLTTADIPNGPDGTLYELAAVRLRAGQEAISENREGTDIVDLRFPMHHRHEAGELIDASLDSLNDVTITSPVSGQVIYFNGLQWVNGTKYMANVAEASDLAAHIADTANPHGVTKSQIGLGYVVNTLYNLAGDRAPDANDDSGDGYSVGSHWLDVSGGVLYICLDAAVGAAAWQEIGSGGGTSATYIVDTDAAYILDAEGRRIIEPASTGGGTDAHAIHDNQANEIGGIVEKTTLAAEDAFLIESPADGGAKRMVKASRFPAADFDRGAYQLMLRPAAVNTEDDHFDATTLAAKWLSFGAPTLSLTALSGWLRGTSFDGTLSGVIQAVPAGDWTIETEALWEDGAIVWSGVGLIMTNGTNKASSIATSFTSGGRNSAGLERQNVSKFVNGNYNLNHVEVLTTGLGRCHRFYKIIKIGTTYYFYASDNRIAWQYFYSASAGTLGYTPTHFGLGGISNGYWNYLLRY